VLAALWAELDWAGHPTVLVVEDMHWADELTREHPLQPLLGQASAAGRVRRLPLRRLTEDGPGG
jgi:hypothetical protein